MHRARGPPSDPGDSGTDGRRDGMSCTYRIVVRYMGREYAVTITVRAQ